ncbi:nuclear transport factor 2 family protein [Streptomyces platensis]|uniref:Nuclear transport factor 2 family protein n=1 Tax=Streptomyces platensis TaxID=58346 RepID=A0AAE6NK31_STRPT|nr:nuclear transport factor 2 family protein [Streptomyces platensis]OSY42989.1 SnoaL-like domain protein [Streptomyces platensis]QEV54207.1 nuclear transport factor 2 family protein [Streptomyces platensis]
MPTTPAHDDTLARRLQHLEDKESLRALMIHGWRALDRKDWRTWIECWAEDAVLEFGPWDHIHGREAILAKVIEAEAPYATMQHHLLNMDFEVRGDRATGIGYMWFVAVTGPGTAASPYAMGGPYAWEYTRTADGWRLTRQQLGVWWTMGEDTLDAFTPAGQGVPPRPTETGEAPYDTP